MNRKFLFFYFREAVFYRLRFGVTLAALIVIGSMAEVSFAQDDELPLGVVPPPLSVLSDDESESLDEETDLKKRTKLAIQLMDSRLALSEASSQKEDHQDSLNQLGYFRAIMNTTMRDLKQNDSRKNILRRYKTFEIALREFIPRIEVVRRTMPFSHAYHVTRLIKSIREARRKSIEPFFSDTVLPDGQSK